MRYNDPLYGPWELPVEVARLVLTDRAARMQDISQSVLPLMFEPFGRMPSRFTHGLGVAHLAVEMLKFQGITLDKRYHRLLPVAAFLHDCGNPPFSHLSEPFLRQDWRHDGESFLTTMLRGSETELVLGELGISVEEITALVTGEDRPVAEVLAGSLDLDNADNVARYWISATNTPAGYNPLVIAQSYRFDPTVSDGQWSLLHSAYEQAQAWKVCREGIYDGLIYSHPHWSAAGMVNRALYMHWRMDGRLPDEFYFMSDKEAAMRLLASPVSETRHLMAKAAKHQWYPILYSKKIEGSVSPRLAAIAADPLGRHTLANRLAKELAVPEHHVCTVVGRGRDRRKITMPFLKPDGEHFCDDDGPSTPVWRVMVWADPRHEHLTDAVATIIEETVL